MATSEMSSSHSEELASLKEAHAVALAALQEQHAAATLAADEAATAAAATAAAEHERKLEAMYAEREAAAKKSAAALEQSRADKEAALNEHSAALERLRAEKKEALSTAAAQHSAQGIPAPSRFAPGRPSSSGAPRQLITRGRQQQRAASITQAHGARLAQPHSAGSPRKRSSVRRSVRLSASACCAWRHTARAWSRSPSCHSTSPRWAPISASG